MSMLFTDRNLSFERCPYCGVSKPTISLINNWVVGKSNSAPDGKYSNHARGYRCTSCGGVIVVGSRDSLNIDYSMPQPKVIDESIPTAAASFLSQAMSSLSIPDGAVMLSASAVDSMLKNKGYKNGSLNQRINKAATDNLITNEMAEWAHDIRLDANDQRHADELAMNANVEDAERSVDFALALAEFLFVLPARVKRGKSKASKQQMEQP